MPTRLRLFIKPVFLKKLLSFGSGRVPRKVFLMYFLNFERDV